MIELALPIERPRILSKGEKERLKTDILDTAIEERFPLVYAHLPEVETFISNSIDLIQRLELATYQRHPQIHTDTDVIYIDSGPGPYSYGMLEEGKTDLDDKNYHKWAWSRKMDRARIRAAYTLASLITAKRIEEEGGSLESPQALSVQDFANHSPYLMYTSVDWQEAHIKHALQIARQNGSFKIPDEKLVMYGQFINRAGEVKPIVHTEDQMEGLTLPNNPDGSNPRRVIIVSHPAHFPRLLSVLGKNPDRIPRETVLQLFPIPTPKDAVVPYATAELLGTIPTILVKQKGSFTPYRNYMI
ncbi:MAG: hypothetical protein AAB532_03575 [Patescibacteria group bacterium]